MESFRRIGALYAVMDGATPDALALASLPELAAAISDRMERLTPASPAGDVLDLIELVDKCDEALNRLALAMPAASAARALADVLENGAVT
jgi:hypothetical protein